VSATVTPFLMFEGRAEEALRFYVDLLPNSSIESIEKYRANEPGAEGSVKRAAAILAGIRYQFIDSPEKHAFGFTPAVSLFIDCDSKEQLEKFAAALGEGGQFMMPQANYGFSQWFCWLQDRWGISWQLNLP
jgi:predicted 3-demethylubiquinone-9 3-methyltransferase (glyoxalase superfamily)